MNEYYLYPAHAINYRVDAAPVHGVCCQPLQNVARTPRICGIESMASAHWLY